MDLTSFVWRSVLVLVFVLTAVHSATVVYTRRFCTCNLVSEDNLLHMAIEPNTTYQAWPSVSCHRARRQCRKHCHQMIKGAMEVMHSPEGPLYMYDGRHNGRRLGYDLCRQYGDSTPDAGVKIQSRSEVEHCSTKDVDPDWSMQLCCGYSLLPNRQNPDEKLFGWYPNCPQRDTIVFA